MLRGLVGLALSGGTVCTLLRPISSLLHPVDYFAHFFPVAGLVGLSQAVNEVLTSGVLRLRVAGPGPPSGERGCAEQDKDYDSGKKRSL